MRLLTVAVSSISNMIYLLLSPEPGTLCFGLYRLCQLGKSNRPRDSSPRPRSPAHHALQATSSVKLYDKLRQNSASQHQSCGACLPELWTNVDSLVQHTLSSSCTQQKQLWLVHIHLSPAVKYTCSYSSLESKRQQHQQKQHSSWWAPETMGRLCSAVLLCALICSGCLAFGGAARCDALAGWRCLRTRSCCSAVPAHASSKAALQQHKPAISAIRGVLTLFAHFKRA